MLYSFDQNQIKDVPSSPLNEQATDEQLMCRIQQGDEEALAALFHRHQALLRTIVGRMINNDHDVDDLLQDFLLELWEQAAKYDMEKGHALGWIVTLVRRRAIDRVRRRAAYARAQERFRGEVAVHGEETHAGADEEVAQNDLARVVTRLIARLPEPQQEAVRFAFYRGMSQREIAAHTGIPLGTIKTRLELALRKLRAAANVVGELHEDFQAASAA